MTLKLWQRLQQSLASDAWNDAQLCIVGWARLCAMQYREGEMAKLHFERPSADRTFLTNIPDIAQPVHAKLSQLVKSLNPAIFVENSPFPLGPIPSSEESDQEWYPNSELSLCIDLLKRCLE